MYALALQGMTETKLWLRRRETESRLFRELTRELSWLPSPVSPAASSWPSMTRPSGVTTR